MLSEQLTNYEKDIHGHLTGMLAAQQFNFDRDVAGITVNRWAHGYGWRVLVIRRERGVSPLGV